MLQKLYGAGRSVVPVSVDNATGSRKSALRWKPADHQNRSSDTPVEDGAPVWMQWARTRVRIKRPKMVVVVVALKTFTARAIGQEERAARHRAMARACPFPPASTICALRR